MNPLKQTKRCTIFKTVRTSVGRPRDLSLMEIAQMVETYTAPRKEALSLIKLARYEGHRRSNDTLFEVGGCEADYDAGRMSIVDAADLLEAADIAALLYETPSSTPTAPRWRAMFVFSGHYSPDKRATFLARANGVLGGVLAPESFTLSQCYFVGHVEGRQPKVRLVKGRFLDQCYDLDAGAIGKGETPKGDAARDETRSARHFRACLDSVRDGLSYSEHLEALDDELSDYAGVGRGSSTKGEHDWQRASAKVEKDAITVVEKFDKVDGERCPITLHPYRNPDAADIPKRDFLYRDAYIRGFVSATVAPGGAAKTSLTITEALGMAAGADLLNIGKDGKAAALARPLRVCVWNLEDDLDESERRIKAGEIHFKDALAETDYQSRLFVNAASETLKIGRAVKGVAELDEKVITGLIAALRDASIDVLIVDPFVACHGVGENDNDSIDLIVKAWGRIAREAGCAVHLVHHTRKPSAGAPRDFQIHDSRGASALINAVRYGRVINRMDLDRAPTMGVASEAAWAFLRVDPGKANLAPPGAATWRRLRSVDLPNGTFEKDDGDRVGVIEAWDPPDLSKTTSGERERIVEAMGQRPWRADPRATGWVGEAFAEALGLQLTNKTARAEVAAKIRAAVKAGWLIEEMEEIGRKARPVLRAKTRRSREDRLGL
jgi:hypothetical protein